MKTSIHSDERITNIRYQIYFKLFWMIIIGETITSLIDSFFQTSLYGAILSWAPCVLVVWMAIKGVLFNGVDHFPRWCWLCSLGYAALNSVSVFVMSFIPDTDYYLKTANERLVAITFFFILNAGIALLFFYIAYRIAKKRILKLSYYD